MVLNLRVVTPLGVTYQIYISDINMLDIYIMSPNSSKITGMM